MRLWNLRRFAGWFALLLACGVLTSPAADTDADKAAMIKESERLWRSGHTLPLEYAEMFPHAPQTLEAPDTGLNILVDNAHQAAFPAMWQLPSELRAMGIRSTASHALLSEVLTPGNPVRVRIPVNGYRPFAWWPVVEWNVVVSFQGDPTYQPYTPEEQADLNAWVREGGGLILMTHPASGEESQSSMHEMLAAWGANPTSEKITPEQHNYPGTVLELSEAWEPLTVTDGKITSARRTLGKGRILITGHIYDLVVLGNEEEALKSRKRDRLREHVNWVASGKPPAGGDARLPYSGGGAGGILPEREERIGDVVLYYAGNQFPEVIDIFQNGLKHIEEKMQDWFPTPPHDQVMYKIAASGIGGGWAVTKWEPFEQAISHIRPRGIQTIYAHELAHTLAGPLGAGGVRAGRSPHWNQGEVHAGWLQGKSDAWLYPEERSKPNKHSDILALEDEKGRMLDLKTEFQNDKMRENWGKPRDWHKLWYIFQKLDDRYGTTWYPRWHWVRNTRWAEAEAAHGDRLWLTWEQTVEDMSIAVGEDLFPFFVKLGTSLDRDQIGPVEFMGETLNLEPAPLERTPAGPVRLEPVGDFTKPLVPRENQS